MAFVIYFHDKKKAKLPSNKMMQSINNCVHCLPSNITLLNWRSTISNISFVSGNRSQETATLLWTQEPLSHHFWYEETPTRERIGNYWRKRIFEKIKSSRVLCRSLSTIKYQLRPVLLNGIDKDLPACEYEKIKQENVNIVARLTSF